MKTSLTSRFNYLRTRLHADFGDDAAQMVWLDAGGGAWVRFRVLQGALRPGQKELAGLLAMPSGGVALHVQKSLWPGVKINDCFLLGPASASNANVPDASSLKYRVTACPSLPQLDWQRVEAERH